MTDETSPIQEGAINPPMDLYGIFIIHCKIKNLPILAEGLKILVRRYRDDPFEDGRDRLKTEGIIQLWSYYNVVLRFRATGVRIATVFFTSKLTDSLKGLIEDCELHIGMDVDLDPAPTC